MEKKEEKNNDLDQEFKGRNLEDAISLAEHTLKLPRSHFNYEVVTEKTKLFGIGSKLLSEEFMCLILMQS